MVLLLFCQTLLALCDIFQIGIIIFRDYTNNSGSAVATYCTVFQVQIFQSNYTIIKTVYAKLKLNTDLNIASDTLLKFDMNKKCQHY